MKIRFLIANAYAVGGTIKTTFNLAGELAKNGHDVEIVSVNQRRPAPEFKVPDGVVLRSLVDRTARMRKAEAARTGVLAKRKLAVKLWALHKPSRLIHHRDYRYKNFSVLTDIKLVQFLRSVDDGVLISTRAGLNMVVARFAKPSVVRVGQEHLNLPGYSDEIKEAYKKYYPRLDLYSTLTQGDAEGYAKLLGDDRHARIECLPNGIPVADPNLRSTTKNKVVIAAGRLTRQKGFDRLLPAWAQAVADHPDWELRIYGGGVLRPNLVKQIADLGIGDSARLMGYTNSLPSELAASGFYVMSSRHEGLPMVLLEAMSHGLPAVSFDCNNGPRDLITPGVNGYLVPNADIPGLAAAIKQMIELDEGRVAFGEAALKTAQAHELPAIAAKWEAVLEEELARKRAESAKR